MSWIRDIFGIRKDIADTKKTKLETESLEKELEEKESPIHKPTFEQIKEYDLKTKRIEQIEATKKSQKFSGGLLTGLTLIIAIIIFSLIKLFGSKIMSLFAKAVDALESLF